MGSQWRILKYFFGLCVDDGWWGEHAWRQGGQVGGHRKSPVERDSGFSQKIIHRDGQKWADSGCILEVQLIVSAGGLDVRSMEKEGINSQYVCCS